MGEVEAYIQMLGEGEWIGSRCGRFTSVEGISLQLNGPNIILQWTPYSGDRGFKYQTVVSSKIFSSFFSVPPCKFLNGSYN
jgi:hypothetical protein